MIHIKLRSFRSGILQGWASTECNIESTGFDSAHFLKGLIICATSAPNLIGMMTTQSNCKVQQNFQKCRNSNNQRIIFYTFRKFCSILEGSY